VGLKPSVGRWARVGGFPAILTDFETLGTLTLTVDDALLLDAALKGPDRRDRRSLQAPEPRPWQGPPRILYVRRFGEAPVDPEVSSAIEVVATTLQAAGHEVEQAPVFFDLEQAARIWRVVSHSGVAWLMRQHPDHERLAGASALAMAAAGREMSGADYLDALEKIAAFRRSCAELFSRFALVLTPTAAALPWPATAPYPDAIDGRAAGPRDHAIFTGWVNISGLPAISLPVALSKSGLPIGAQFVADFGADDALLDFARSFSARMPPPPLPAIERLQLGAMIARRLSRRAAGRRPGSQLSR
jgi:aspartyl-tRNA(Asn)/glutamyl-tRNA(Gln) amidotransferase subunit A